MGQAVLRETRVCSLIARSAGRIIGHIGMCPRQFIVSGDGSDASIDNARHRLAGLGLRIPAWEPY